MFSKILIIYHVSGEEKLLKTTKSPFSSNFCQKMTKNLLLAFTQYEKHEKFSTLKTIDLQQF